MFLPLAGKKRKRILGHQQGIATPWFSAMGLLTRFLSTPRIRLRAAHDRLGWASIPGGVIDGARGDASIRNGKAAISHDAKSQQAT